MFAVFTSVASASYVSLSVKSNACNGEYVDVTVSGRYDLTLTEYNSCMSLTGSTPSTVKKYDVTIDLYEHDTFSSDFIDGNTGSYPVNWNSALNLPGCNWVNFQYTFTKRLSDWAGGLEGNTIELYSEASIYIDPDGFIIEDGYDKDIGDTPLEYVNIISGQCGSGVCCDLSTCNFRPASYKCADNVQLDYGCPWGTSPGADVGVQYADRYCPGSSSSCSGSLQWDTWSVYDNCNSNEMCIDNNPTCQGVQCDSNSDCGTSGWIGSPYCSGNDVYQTYRTWTCNNPGTPSSYCSYSDQQMLKQTCTSCSGGACAVECSSNSDCGTGGWWINDEYCSGGDVWDTWREHKCFNPGTSSSYCGYSNSDLKREDCPNGCSGGECTIECSSNPDCGANGWLNNNYCNGNNVWDYYRTWTCSSPGTKYSDCSYADNTQLKQTCPNTCLGGVCSTVACYNSADCGANSWLGNEYCSGNNVMDTYRIYICSNPGTASASCSYSDAAQVKEACTYGCSSGACEVPACFNNSDCGANVWLGNGYCNGTDAWDTYRTWTCSNPGTLSASCSYSDDNQLRKACLISCINDSCDDEDHLWISDYTDNMIFRVTLDGSVTKSFASPGTDTMDLAFDGTYLWAADYMDAKIYKLDTDGNVLGGFFTIPVWPRGLTFDGTYLWYSDLVNSYKATTSGTLIASYGTIGDGTTGLAYNGTELFSADINDDMIYWYNLAAPTGFNSAGTLPNGLTWGGGYFWNVEGSDNKIYKFTPDGTIAGSFSAPGSGASGIAYEYHICYNDADCGEDGWLGTNYCNGDDVWDTYRDFSCINPGTVNSRCSVSDTDTLKQSCGEGCENGECLAANGYLWVSDTTDIIYKLNTSGAVVDSFSSPGCAFDGLTWDGVYIWRSDTLTDRIYKLTTDGTVVDSFNSPGFSPVGLAWDGTYLWNIDSSSDKIYKLTTDGTVVDSFNAAPVFVSSGLAWDGAYLWSADTVSDKIYKLTTDGTVVDSFDSPGVFPYGLAWDGTYLWNVDSLSDKIYKLTTDGTIVDSFNSPVADPYGLAWQPIIIACYLNSDCGADGLVGDTYCSGDDVYQDYRTWTCNDPGTASASCSYSDAGQLKQSCADTCVAGSCVSIECYDDSDCGADGWVGADYCNGDELRDTFKEYTCSNPGTASASCSSTETDQLKQICRNGCFGGSCLTEGVLWNADSGTDKIYKLTTNGTILNSFSSPGTSPSGLTWDGNYLWNADNNLDRIYKLTINGLIVYSFDSPGTSPSGLTWDGNYLWNADYNTDKIYKLTTDGTVVSSFNSPGTFPRGLAWQDYSPIVCSSDSDCGADGFIRRSNMGWNIFVEC